MNELQGRGNFRVTLRSDLNDERSAMLLRRASSGSQFASISNWSLNDLFDGKQVSCLSIHLRGKPLLKSGKYLNQIVERIEAV